MNRFILGMLDKVRPVFEKDGQLHSLFFVFDAMDTFFATPEHKTDRGAHVRDPMDFKRMMMSVIYALIPCILIGIYNIGYQGYLGEGVEDPALVDSFLRGLWHFLPLMFVSYAVGGFWELLFASIRRHEVAEGFLVSAMLYPLILPPTTPLWMAALGMSFGILIGKEVFGGVGMNILNPALTARAFVFFTYPVVMSGPEVWDVAGKSPDFLSAGPVVDSYTGATPLLAAAEGAAGSQAAELVQHAGFSFMDAFIGLIPGSIGEVSALGALIGAVVLLAMGVISWRILTGTVLGLAAVVGLFGLLAGPESNALMTLPLHYHLVLGGFAFGAVFMATDPVSAAHTTTGKWLYGLGIGVLAGLVRVINPAYPEGMMLAILFMNVMAPAIDYFVVRRSTRARIARRAEQGA